EDGIREDLVTGVQTCALPILSWGPGLRWGIMGNMMLNHLGGGPGGIEHFLQQFTGPMTAWWKTLGSPVLTPEVQKKLIDSVHARSEERRVGKAARAGSPRGMQ